MAHRAPLGPGRRRRLGRPGAGCGGPSGERLALGVQYGYSPTEQRGHGRGDVRHLGPAQHQVGEPVVAPLGALDGGGVGADQLVGAVQLGERGPGVGERLGGVQRDRGVRGQGAQQCDLVGGERAGRAVGGEQHPDHPPAEQQRDADDRHQALVDHARVDHVGVVEAVVGAVVGGGVRAGALRDQAAEAVAEAEPQGLEEDRDRAVGDPHVGVAGGFVREGEVGGVGAQQHPGPADDRLQHGVEVAGGGEVAGGVEEGGQLGLAAPVLAQGPVDPQCLPGRVVDLAQHVGRRAPAARVGQHVGEVLGGGAGGEQVQQSPQCGRRAGVEVVHGTAANRQWVFVSRGGKRDASRSARVAVARRRPYGDGRRRAGRRVRRWPPSPPWPLPAPRRPRPVGRRSPPPGRARASPVRTAPPGR